MGRERYRRDSAGVGPDPVMAGQLYSMGDVRGYKIADGEPDIRGWDVRTISGSEIGEVDDLLIDPHRSEVVMLDIDLKDSDEHVNVPIRSVQIDRERNCVIVDSGDIRLAREALIGDKVEVIEDVRPVDDRTVDTNRDVRYGLTRDDPLGEEVLQSRPMVEEVVVRRRVIDGTDELRDGKP